jgi:hypothetical protein
MDEDNIHHLKDGSNNVGLLTTVTVNKNVLECYAYEF